MFTMHDTITYTIQVSKDGVLEPEGQVDITNVLSAV